mgnify:CR=1 FL=1
MKQLIVVTKSPVAPVLLMGHAYAMKDIIPKPEVVFQPMKAAENTITKSKTVACRLKKVAEAVGLRKTANVLRRARVAVMVTKTWVDGAIG